MSEKNSDNCKFQGMEGFLCAQSSPRLRLAELPFVAIATVRPLNFYP